MENKDTKKVSKKALRSMLKDSVQQSLGNLELPKANKKVKRIISRSTKQLAAEFVQILKKDLKRSKPKNANAAVAPVAVQVA